MTSSTYCTFTIAGELFGVEASQVETLLGAQRVTPVPRAPSVVRGLLNLHGRIVPAIDLRACFELGPRGPEEPSSNVVIRTRRGLASLLVDELVDVVELVAPSPGESVAAPADELASVLGSVPRELVRGACDLAGRRLWLLDAARVVELRPVDVA